jgi:hypothetical protein
MRAARDMIRSMCCHVLMFEKTCGVLDLDATG